jgi:hypothetical protein
MTEYHCYFGTRTRLCKKVDVDTADDALAIIEAERILVDTKQDAMEVWRGHRLISRTSRSKPAA